MSEIHTALQDINWLSQRLKGIMALSSEIEDYDRMKDQAADLDKSINSKKEEINELLVSKENILKLIDSLTSRKEELLKSTKTEVDGVLARNNLAASAIFEKAKEEAKALRSALEAERIAYQEKINKAQDKLNDLVSNIATKQTIFDELKASIDQIKAKL